MKINSDFPTRHKNWLILAKESQVRKEDYVSADKRGRKTTYSIAWPIDYILLGKYCIIVNIIVLPPIHSSFNGLRPKRVVCRIQWPNKLRFIKKARSLIAVWVLFYVGGCVRHGATNEEGGLPDWLSIDVIASSAWPSHWPFDKQVN